MLAPQPPNPSVVSSLRELSAFKFFILDADGFPTNPHFFSAFAEVNKGSAQQQAALIYLEKLPFAERAKLPFFPEAGDSYTDLIVAALHDVMFHGSQEEKKAAFLHLIRASQQESFPASTKQRLVNVIRNLNSQGAFTRLTLGGADLSGLDLSELNLSETDLSRACLTMTNLTKTNLTKAGLVKADLSRAILTKTNLTGAKVDEEGLMNATLTEVVFFNTIVTDARGLTRLISEWSTEHKEQAMSDWDIGFEHSLNSVRDQFRKHRLAE